MGCSSSIPGSTSGNTSGSAPPPKGITIKVEPDNASHGPTLSEYPSKKMVSHTSEAIENSSVEEAPANVYEKSMAKRDSIHVTQALDSPR